MKLIATLAVTALGQYDPNNVEFNHHNGCLFPTSEDKAMISNDPFAQFSLASGANNNGAYEEGSQLSRECAIECTYDGSNTSCTYGESDTSFTCIAKEGKGSRKGHTFYVFAEDNQSKKIPKAAFFRGSTYQNVRPAGKKLLCPQPVVTVSNPDAVCGERPSIPSKSMRFNQYTVYTDDLSSVECLPNGIPKVKKPKTLNLVCAKKTASKPYEWLSLETNKNGKETLVKPSNGANKLKDKYLCKFNPNYTMEESGDGSGEGSGEEGSGADTVGDAVVSM